MALFGKGGREIGCPKEMDRFIDDATQAGLDVVELQWNKIGFDVITIMGIDMPVIHQAAGAVFADRADYQVKMIKDGVYKFYPDTRGRKWAYVVLTERNRRWMAETYYLDMFRIIDGTIKKEIEALVEKLGVKPVLKNYEDAKVIDDKASALKKQNADLEAQLAALKAELEEATKPLKGISIDKPKVKNL